jgi:hypothetical protein
MPRLATGLLSAVVLCGACYDWTIGTTVADRDAGDAAMPGGPDAGTDTASPTDSRAPVDSFVEELAAPDADAASCASLQESVDADRVAAKVCMSTCMSTVTDQCGCTVFVAQSSSAATAAYKAAVTDLMKSGCPINCGTCVNPTASFCLAGTGPDGGVAAICMP